MASIPTRKSGASAEAVIACLERDGCVIVADALGAAAASAIRDDLAPHLTEKSERRANEMFDQQGASEFLPGNTRRTTGLIAKSPTARDLPQQLQALIEYQIHNPGLGYASMGDPSQMLRR
ncbi:MAG: hypothetical protein ACREQB_02790 [Candidatus Binataceae bacterium]